MKVVAMVYRKLKEGKTFDDYRKAWYHTHGFGVPTKMYTIMNVFDPREIISLGIMETSTAQLPSVLQIDVKERLISPLDDVIEKSIVRHFGVVVSEDDFSPTGIIEYKHASVDGIKVNFADIEEVLRTIAEMIAKASQDRERLKEVKNQEIG